MNLQLINLDNLDAAPTQVSLNAELFGCEYNEALVHQVVVCKIAQSHAGETKRQKTRCEVSGGGSKPWRQKGTGRARAGTTRGPIWRKGGRAFAARGLKRIPKINKKMYRTALKCVLSELIRQERVTLIKGFNSETGKTKEMMDKLANWLNAGHVEILSSNIDDALFNACNNIPALDLRKTADLSLLSLIKAEHVLICDDSLTDLEGLVA
jgi:large subunit ribosomal protein L4